MLVKVKVAQSCLTVCHPMDFHSPWNSPGQNTGVGSLFLLQGIFLTQGSNPGPALQVDSLPAEPQGKPKNTGVGSLSLLQGIFLTRESNPALLLCRWILYHLSYQGSPGCWWTYSFMGSSVPQVAYILLVLQGHQ